MHVKYINRNASLKNLLNCTGGVYINIAETAIAIRYHRFAMIEWGVLYVVLIHEASPCLTGIGLGARSEVAVRNGYNKDSEEDNLRKVVQFVNCIFYLLLETES